MCSHTSLQVVSIRLSEPKTYSPVHARLLRCAAKYGCDHSSLFQYGSFYTTLELSKRLDWEALLTVNILIYFLLQIKKRSTMRRLFRPKDSKESMCYPVSCRTHRDS